MNPAPDAELASVGEYNHNWIVDNMTDFILKKLEGEIETPEYRWSAMLNPPAKKSSVKTKTTTAEKRVAAPKEVAKSKAPVAKKAVKPVKKSK
jgi:hypothetical protein